MSSQPIDVVTWAFYPDPLVFQFYNINPSINHQLFGALKGPVNQAVQFDVFAVVFPILGRESWEIENG
jgi:hypothetical protein